MPASPAARPPKVIRAAVLVDDLPCDEVHQTGPGAITAGVDLRSDIFLFGRNLPQRHRLFDYQGGQYFLDLPVNARGRISMRGRVATVPELRRRHGHGTKLRVRLDPSARGKIRLGETTILFRFDRPARRPPILRALRPARPRPTARSAATCCARDASAPASSARRPTAGPPPLNMRPPRPAARRRRAPP